LSSNHSRKPASKRIFHSRVEHALLTLEKLSTIISFLLRYSELIPHDLCKPGWLDGETQAVLVYCSVWLLTTPGIGGRGWPSNKLHAPHSGKIPFTYFEHTVDSFIGNPDGVVQALTLLEKISRHLRGGITTPRNFMFTMKIPRSMQVSHADHGYHWQGQDAIIDLGIHGMSL
jgi:hypothetical protein